MKLLKIIKLYKPSKINMFIYIPIPIVHYFASNLCLQMFIGLVLSPQLHDTIIWVTVILFFACSKTWYLAKWMYLLVLCCNCLHLFSFVETSTQNRKLHMNTNEYI